MFLAVGEESLPYAGGDIRSALDDERGDDIGKGFAGIFHGGGWEIRGAGSIEVSAAVGIDEEFVGGLDGDEAFLIAAIGIGVVLLGHLAVRLADFLLGGGGGDAEGMVGVHATDAAGG